MLATAAHRTGSPPKTTKAKRSWVSVVLVLAIVLAGMAVVAAEARAGSFSDEFPKMVLMKDDTRLQGGRLNYADWHWYEAGEWQEIYADGPFPCPRADLVRAGSGLHIKLNKPERPASFKILAYKEAVEGFPSGESRRLDTKLRRIERDGKTVGWNVFFRVNRPDRHYYLETYATWARVPGTHISWGHEALNYHVKTR